MNNPGVPSAPGYNNQEKISSLDPVIKTAETPVREPLPAVSPVDSKPEISLPAQPALEAPIQPNQEFDLTASKPKAANDISPEEFGRARNAIDATQLTTIEFNQLADIYPRENVDK